MPSRPARQRLKDLRTNTWLNQIHPALAFPLLRSYRDHGVRAALERFDWKAVQVLRQKNRKSWDAITQLIRYTNVVGRGVPVSAQSIQSGELFIEAPRPSDKS